MDALTYLLTEPVLRKQQDRPSSIECGFRGFIRGTFKEKLCQELGFETLKDRFCYLLKRLCYL